MKDYSNILVVGGYGHVGRRITVELSSLYPGQVFVAGRDFQKAETLANHIGKNVRPLQLDVNDPARIDAVLASADLVVNCIDQTEPYLLRMAVRGGLAYLDITARLAFWHEALAMDQEARRTGARVLLGGGLIPGIANVMARAAAERVGEVMHVDTGILLSLGDSFGPAALDYTLSSAGEPFAVTEDGNERIVQSFTERQVIDFPPPVGRRKGFRFGFPEQVFYPQTLGVRRASTWLALDPPWVTILLATLARMRLLSSLRQRYVRRASARLFEALRRLYRGRETYALVVEAKGASGRSRLGFVGKNESDATALGAAVMVRRLLNGDHVPAGVWLPEQVVEPSLFFNDLAARGLQIL